MYSVIKNVITNTEFNLSLMLKKIETLWVEGHLTDTQRAELQKIARERASASNSVDILKKLDDFERRIRVLEDSQSSSSSEEGDESYEPYQSGKWYYAGDRVVFDGLVYECSAPEQAVCVWSPSEYPAYWTLV